MKNIYFSIVMLFCFNSFGQFSDPSVAITSVSSSAVAGGININLQVSRVHAASFLSHTYTVNGTAINLSVCYFISPLTMPVNLNNNFLIPVSNNTNHTIFIDIMNSTSPTVCNNFLAGQTTILNYLDNDSFDLFKQDYLLFPNPTNRKIAFKNTEKTFKQISFFDIQGRLVKQFTSNFKDGFDLIDLENGIYLVKVESENGHLTQKIVLKK